MRKRIFFINVKRENLKALENQHLTGLIVSDR